MVSNQALGAICVEVGLHDHLMFESFDLANKIRAYADILKQKRDAEYQLAKEEDRAPGQYWIETTPPKARLHTLWTSSRRMTLVSGALRYRRVSNWCNLLVGQLLARGCAKFLRQDSQAVL